MKKIFILLFFLLLPLPIIANQELDVVINEIAWMGTKANSSDEWIELYNNTNQEINLDGWFLYEDSIKIEPLIGTIQPYSYYLIERTDDLTIKNIKASQEPSGWSGYGLNNSGEILKLINNDSVIIDQVDCSNGWFEGDKEQYKTMERISSTEQSSPDNWQTNYSPLEAVDSNNNLINGTPKSPNSQKKETINYSSEIIINEIFPSPKGADSENEWIKLKNNGSKSISLLNWKIEDTVGVTTTYTIQNKTIEAQSFITLKRPQTKIILNNGGDCLKLIQPNNNILHSVCFENAISNSSYLYKNDKWEWINQNTEESIKNSYTTTTNQKQTINNQPDNITKEVNKIKITNKKEKIGFLKILIIGSAISCLFSFFIVKLKQKLT
jgi:hypothetical protein